MMKTKILLLSILLITITAFTFVSCDKEQERSPVISTVEDDAIADVIFDDIFAEVESAIGVMEGSLYGGAKKSEEVIVCKTITVEHPNDSTIWPRTITIDYGEGCTGPNGVVRKGEIVIVVNMGRFWLEGFSRTITFVDFYLDDFKVEGTKVISNEGENDNDNIVFSVSLTGGKVIAPDGREITREVARQREWVAGSNTPWFRFDDEYMVTGQATGTDRKERAFTRTINSPLHLKLACRWIVAGSVLFETEDLPDALLDYGDGTCDRNATVTVDGVTKDILLHR